MSGIVWAPIAMSFGVMLIVVANLVFHINPLPIHDEGAMDHIGMLLYWGQLPLIGLYVLSNLSHLRKIAVRLAVLAILFAGITVLVSRTDQMARAGVAERIAANLPMKGSEQALHKAILDAGSPAPTTLTFKGVDKIGWDIYQAQFDDSQQEWRIFVDQDGKAAGVTYFDGEGRCHSTEPYECR
jgi:hypothetical protein